MQSLDEETVGLVQLGKNVLMDGCHDAHGADNVCGVAELNSNLRVLSLQGAHDEGNDVQGTTAHGALEQTGQGLLHFDGVAPVIGRACAFFSLEQMKVRSSTLQRRQDRRKLHKSSGIVITEANEGTGVNQFLCQAVIFFLSAIHPVDVCGLGQCRNLANPIQEALVGGGCALQLLSSSAERVRVEVSAIDVFPFNRWPGYCIDPVRSAVTKKKLNTTSVQTKVNMHA